MKKKTLAGLISSLICISLIGVGFAAWVVTGDATDKSSEGTISAEAITDKSVGITLAWESATNKDSTIHFGAPAGGNVSNGKWLVNDQENTDDLQAVLKVTVTNPDNLNTLTATVTPTLETKSTYDAAIDAGVIVAPEIGYGGSGANRTVTITFKYGASFGSSNPYTFYNAKKPTDMVADVLDSNNQITAKAHAIKYITELKKIDTVKYVVTVTATAKTNA